MPCCIASRVASHHYHTVLHSSVSHGCRITRVRVRMPMCARARLYIAVKCGIFVLHQICNDGYIYIYIYISVLNCNSIGSYNYTHCIPVLLETARHRVSRPLQGAPADIGAPPRHQTRPLDIRCFCSA